MVEGVKIRIVHDIKGQQEVVMERGKRSRLKGASDKVVAFVKGERKEDLVGEDNINFNGRLIQVLGAEIGI